MTADPLAAQPDPGDLPPPGSWRSALNRPDAPGAVLDREPWAASWGAFLAAVNDPRDPSARQVIANAMGERVPAEGGFLVPERLRSQVMAYLTPAIVRPQAMVLPMTGPRVGVPVLDNPTQSQALGGLTFSIVEAGQTIPSSNPALAREFLDARKAAAYLQGVPNELADDATAAMGDLLARVIALGLDWYQDDLFIYNGTGAGQPQALVNAPAAFPVARQGAGKVQFLDVVGMFKALHPASKQAGMTPGVTDVMWLLSGSAMDQVLELNYQVTIATTTTPIPPPGWFTMGDGDKIGPSMLGLPARVTDHQPAVGTPGDVILADLGKYMIGDWLELLVERSAGGSGFPADTSNFRVRTRFDGRCWVPSTTTTEAGQTVSPVVVLQ